MYRTLTDINSSGDSNEEEDSSEVRNNNSHFVISLYSIRKFSFFFIVYSIFLEPIIHLLLEFLFQSNVGHNDLII